MKYHIPAVIFAGGKSSRMGEDKALLPFDGYRTLTHYQYERLQKLFSSVFISTKEKKFDFEATLIYDTYHVNSPLGALVTLFETLHVAEVFVLSVDAPFVNDSVINTIMENRKEEYDAIIAKTHHGIQPLCGIYRRAILPLAKTALHENQHKLTQLLHHANTLYLPFEEETLFANLNHPHEYAKALETLKKR